MALKPIGFEEAAAYSPWPKRITGEARWRKERRNYLDIELEYNGVYKDLEDEWVKFASGLPSRNPAACLQFYDRIRRVQYRKIADHPNIYGDVDLENYLVSANDRLYLASIFLFETMMRQLVIETVNEARSIQPFGGVLEVGCGSGINLLNLHLYQGLEIVGVDLSPRAIAFLQRMAADVGLEANFSMLNFLKDDLVAAAPKSSWSLMSFHAVEQAESIEVGWFEGIVKSPRPPVFGLHFEPLQIPDGSPFADQCCRYAQINLYNVDFYKVAREAEARGLIKIVRERKRVLGLSAFNPTSVLVWTPA